jgi:hypothetical protein
MSRKTLFPGRFSGSTGFDLDVLIARREFIATNVTNMNRKMRDLSMSN